MTAQLEVGVATVDITPPPGVAMSGFAARVASSVAAHDPLTARAIAFTSHRSRRSDHESIASDRHAATALFVVADLLALEVDQTLDLRMQISRRTGLAPENVVVAVTHTHAGPHVTRDSLGPRTDHVVAAAVEDGIIEAGVRAWNARVPARVGHGVGEEHTVARNRRHVGGRADPTVTVVRVDTEDGDPLAVVFSYSCHPTVLGPANLLFSADWPGFARSRIETAFPSATAIFLQGCSGDVNAGHSAHSSMTLNSTDDRTFERAALLGELVADVAIQVARNIHPVDRARLTATSVEVPMKFATPFSKRDYASLRADAEHKLRSRPQPDRETVLNALLHWAERGVQSDFAPAPTAVLAAITIGELVVVTLPGEPFVAVALDLRARIAGRPMLVLGYANGVPGYVPYPPDEYRFGGYEVQEAHYFYQRAQCFAPDCGPELIEAAFAAVVALPDRW